MPINIKKMVDEAAARGSAGKKPTLESQLAVYSQPGKNFDAAGVAKATRSLAKQTGMLLTEEELASAVKIFGEQHRKQFRSGYTSSSNYEAIAQRIVTDAMSAKGVSPTNFVKNTQAWVKRGEQNAHARSKAEQDAEGGALGGFGSLVGGILGAVFAPMTFGLSAALGSALGAAGGTLLDGGDPMDALLNGGLAYLGTSILAGAGGEAAGAAGAEVAAGGAMDMGVGLNEVAAGFGVGPDAAGLIGSQMISPEAGDFLGTGVSTSPADTLMGAPASSGASVAQAAETGAFDMHGAASQPGSTQTIFDQPGGGGIIESVLNWGKENPVLASGVMQVGGGVIKGIGDNITANELMDKRTAADRELLEQKQQNEMELQEWKRKFIQGGSYFDAQLPFSPKPGVLKRPDGSPVYGAPGIITGAMNG